MPHVPMMVRRRPCCRRIFLRARLFRRRQLRRLFASSLPHCALLLRSSRFAATVLVGLFVNAAVAFTSYLLVMRVVVWKRGFGTRRSAINRTPVVERSQKCAWGGTRTHTPFGNTILSGVRLPITPPGLFNRVTYFSKTGRGAAQQKRVLADFSYFFTLCMKKYEKTAPTQKHCGTHPSPLFATILTIFRRRRPGSNRRIAVLQTAALTNFATTPLRRWALRPL